MNLIIMRHGESTDNVKNIISDKEIYWSTLTIKGKASVKKSIEFLPSKIDKVYVSPLPRTIQTANYVYKKYKNTEFEIDSRIKEVQYGKYSHCKNDNEIHNIRINQIKGDYFYRFGETGENRYEIEARVNDFLLYLFNKYKNNETILVITHGSISSYIKRALNIEFEHLQMGEIKIINNVNFISIKENLKKLRKIKEGKIK